MKGAHQAENRGVQNEATNEESDIASGGGVLEKGQPPGQPSGPAGQLEKGGGAIDGTGQPAMAPHQGEHGSGGGADEVRDHRIEKLEPGQKKGGGGQGQDQRNPEGIRASRQDNQSGEEIQTGDEDMKPEVDGGKKPRGKHDAQ